jgi:cytochrome c2
MTRAILGTGLIVLTMVLTAWVAINEPTRIEQYNAQFQGRAIENGAASFELYCQNCHGVQGEGVGGLGPPLNPRLFTEREPQLKAERWGGGIDDYIELTIAGGRPVRSVDFADAGFVETMPTWSERYRGPLRDDQIRDLVAFIMNWREQAGQPTPTPAAPAADGNFPPAEPLPAGDPARGQALLNGDQRSGVTGAPLPCFGCHVIPGAAKAVGTTGPTLAGIATTAGQRLGEGYQGQATDAQGYVHESIVQPNAYIVQTDPKYTSPTGQSVMPPNLAATMTSQDLADIIAYLMTLE